jgi:hypothetical protein
MLNPANSKYDSQVSGISFASENDDIRASLSSVVNYRVGGEFRHDIFRLRLGYGSFGNPYKNENIRYSSQYLSAGAGVRTQTFYADFALVARRKESVYYPYVSENYGDPVTINSKINSFVLTFGFTF